MEIRLKGKPGKNGIHFIGKGTSDGYGAQIHNVQLLRENGCDVGFEDLIVNGKFREGNDVGHGFKYFKG